MNKNSTPIKCCQCGYEFQLTADLRCPRCFSPVVKYGGCSGSCSTCSANPAKKDKPAG